VTVHLERERYLQEYRKPPVPKKITLFKLIENLDFTTDWVRP
jgi:hypothetical protein